MISFNIRHQWYLGILNSYLISLNIKYIQWKTGPIGPNLLIPTFPPKSKTQSIKRAHVISWVEPEGAVKIPPNLPDTCRFRKHGMSRWPVSLSWKRNGGVTWGSHLILIFLLRLFWYFDLSYYKNEGFVLRTKYHEIHIHQFSHWRWKCFFILIDNKMLLLNFP